MVLCARVLEFLSLILQLRFPKRDGRDKSQRLCELTEGAGDFNIRGAVETVKKN